MTDEEIKSLEMQTQEIFKDAAPVCWESDNFYYIDDDSYKYFERK